MPVRAEGWRRCWLPPVVTILAKGNLGPVTKAHLAAWLSAGTLPP